MPFIVAWWEPVSDSTIVEGIIHAELKHLRSNKRREFFKIECRDAIKVVAKCSAKYPPSIEQLAAQRNEDKPIFDWLLFGPQIGRARIYQGETPDVVFALEDDCYRAGVSKEEVAILLTEASSFHYTQAQTLKLLNAEPLPVGFWRVQ